MGARGSQACRQPESHPDTSSDVPPDGASNAKQGLLAPALAPGVAWSVRERLSTTGVRAVTFVVRGGDRGATFFALGASGCAPPPEAPSLPAGRL
jgi:hypothetical protein